MCITELLKDLLNAARLASGEIRNAFEPRAFQFCDIMQLYNFPKPLCPYLWGIQSPSQKMVINEMMHFEGLNAQ